MTRLAKICIVDDDDGVRTSLSSLIRSLGYDVRTYPSAVDFLDRQESDEPDCLITDLQMPRMTGEQLQARLVQDGRRFPIIVMTAFPSENSRTRILAAGASAYLVKPLDESTLTRHIAEALRGRDGLIP